MDTPFKKPPPPPPPPLGHHQPVSRHDGERAVPAPPVGRQSTPDLVKEITRDTIDLAKKQLELTIAEARADLKAEVQAVTGFALAIGGALFAIALLLATAVLGLSRI